MGGREGGRQERSKVTKKNIQLKKRIRNLQHKNMRMIMLMTDQDALTRTAHAMLFVMLLEPLEPREHRRVFFGLVLLGPEGVVAERIESDRARLVGGKGFGEDGAGIFELVVRTGGGRMGGGRVGGGEIKVGRYVRV